MSLPEPPPLDLDRVALFLDVDGTLAPIAPRPEQVSGDEALWRLLDALERGLGGRLALVSGRALDDVDRIAGGGTAALAGVHGLERRRADGRLIRAEHSQAIEAARREMTAFAEAHPGVQLEDKELGLALHYRLAPEHAEAVAALGERLGREQGLYVQAGSMVQEVRAPGGGKDAALRAFMDEPPFRGASPVFVGDDLTDEPAFVAAAELGGFGVIVGSREPTAAAWRARDVAACRAWLASLVAEGVGA